MSAEAELIFNIVGTALANKREADILRRNTAILNKSLKKALRRKSFFVGTTIALGVYAIFITEKSSKRISALENELKNEKKKAQNKHAETLMF